MSSQNIFFSLTAFCLSFLSHPVYLLVFHLSLSKCKWSGTSVFVATATTTLSLMVAAETLEL